MVPPWKQNNGFHPSIPHYQQSQGIKPSIKQQVRVNIGGMFVNRSGCTYCGERNHNIYTFRHGGPIRCVQCDLTGTKEKCCPSTRT